MTTDDQVRRPADELPLLVLDASPSSARDLIARAWADRQILYVLSRKEFFVRYRRASLGLAWGVGLPLIQALVLAVLFHRVSSFRSGHSYIGGVMLGMVVVSYVIPTATVAVGGIIDNSALSSRIYFPRALLALVPMLANIVSLLTTAVVAIVVAVSSGAHLTPRALLLVPALLATMLFTALLSLLLAGGQVYFRDIRYIIQAISTVAIYVTPVVYPLTVLSGAVRTFIIWANPMVGLVEIMKAAVGDQDQWWRSSLIATLLWSVVIGVTALELHRRRDRVFADLL